MSHAAVYLLLAFSVIAAVDGFYFHLYRYRLWERPRSRREHMLHTWNAVLMPLSIAPLFLAAATGAWLWGAALLHAATAAIESADVFTEGDSRADLGGLTPAEYWMHFMMSGLRWAYAALAFAALPDGVWTAPASWEWRLPVSATDGAGVLAWGVALGGVPAAAWHVWLARRGATGPARVVRAEA
jgi:hypothetical protein